MGAIPEPSVYEVSGFHVHNIQEETMSFNCWGDPTEHVVSTCCDCGYQDSWLERGAAKRCLESTRLSGADRHGKFKTRGLQSGQGALKRRSIGVRVKEEHITQNIKAKNVHVSSMPGLEDLEVRRSSPDGKHLPQDVIIVEDDSDDNDNETGVDSKLNTEDLSNDSEEDENDCQIFCSGRFMPLKSINRFHRQRSSRQNIGGHYRYVCRSTRSSDSDSTDCQIMEGSYGKIREQWEQVALRKQVFHGIKCKEPLVEEELSASGSNIDPNSPLREFEREGRNEKLDTNFQGRHVDCSIGPPDLGSVSGIVYTLDQDDVTSHQTPMELESQNPSADICNGSSFGQPTNTVELQPSREGNERDQNSYGVKIREVLWELPHAISQVESNKILTLKSSSGETKLELAMVESSCECVADRENLKKTVASRHAEEEEWPWRQLKLQHQDCLPGAMGNFTRT